MKNVTSLEFTRENFETRLDGEVVIFHIKKNAFSNFTDLEVRDVIIPWLEAVDNYDQIKGVLFLNDYGVFGEKEYHTFIEGMAGKLEKSGDHFKVPRFEKSEIRAIEINLIVTYIKKILGMRKLIAFAMQGDVVTPYFGVSLAADLRYGTPKTNFALSHIKYGLHPTGALPFFLPRYIGIGRSVEYLLKGGKIDSAESLNLGILNKVIPDDVFRDEVIREFKSICKLDLGVIKSTKELIYSFQMQFDKFLEKESHFIYH
ncbi:MAG: hypothetical protein SCALA702_34160 [Melioribacteraceae bacterium]|nr:MAG: hypothetical protein SCALA702_34160 [Melioribacteraceae bacterium]